MPDSSSSTLLSELIIKIVAKERWSNRPTTSSKAICPTATTSPLCALHYFFLDYTLKKKSKLHNRWIIPSEIYFFSCIVLDDWEETCLKEEKTKKKTAIWIKRRIAISFMELIRECVKLHGAYGGQTSVKQNKRIVVNPTESWQFWQKFTFITTQSNICARSQYTMWEKNLKLS